MKSSHSLISKLKSTPEFKRLREIDDIAKIINALPLEMRKYISFGIQKKQKLCFALNNPLLCTEYNRYKSSLVLEICQNYEDYFTGLKDITEVWFYYPQTLKVNQQGKYFKAPKHFATLSERREVVYLQTYKEQAKGEFQNNALNPKIYDIFEKIRKNIIKNHNA